MNSNHERLIPKKREGENGVYRPGYDLLASDFSGEGSVRGSVDTEQ
jgi:hypothetical protein